MRDSNAEIIDSMYNIFIIECVGIKNFGVMAKTNVKGEF